MGGIEGKGCVCAREDYKGREIERELDNGDIDYKTLHRFTAITWLQSARDEHDNER